MISSALAEPEIHDSVPSSMTLERLVARRVPFDIEAVRGKDEKEHVKWLIDERGLQRSGAVLFHDIAIYRLTHRTTDNSEN